MRFLGVLVLILSLAISHAEAQPAYAVNDVVQAGIYTVVSPYSGFGTDTLAGCNAQCAIGFGGSMKIIAIVESDVDGPESIYFVRYTPTAGANQIAGECKGNRAYFDMTEAQLNIQQARRNAIVANPPQ